MTPDIDEWKKEYGRIYRIVIGPYECIYRRLTAAEYMDIVDASLSDCALDDAIVRGALLYPQLDPGATYTRVYSQLSSCIVEASMLGEAGEWQRHIDMRKAAITPRRGPGNALVTDDPIMGLILHIIGAFPSYRPEDLLHLPIEDILDRVAWADVMLGNVDKPEAPRNMPMGLSGPERQQYLDDVASKMATAGAAALREEMRNAKAKS